MKEKVMIAMSGGVDSAIVAYLLRDAGYDTFAATIRLGDLDGGCTENPCGSDENVADARKLAEAFGMTHYAVDLTEEFRSAVVDNFINTYISGGTPNPCIECNRHIKFGALLGFALSKGASKIATGHYADVKPDANGRFLLCRSQDPAKDQTYVLWRLTQDQLSHVIFPLAKYKKNDVRAIAESLGLAAAHRKESQDICFIPDGDYASFIERATKKTFPCGDFVDITGKKLGTHRGIIHYTIGQRKGLGIALGEPTYVGAKSPLLNTVTLCRNEELFSSRLTARNINLIACDSIPTSIRVTAKIRYKHNEEFATVVQTDADRFTVEFDHPQRAISPGQSVVMYDGDTVIGGGIIE